MVKKTFHATVPLYRRYSNFFASYRNWIVLCCAVLGVLMRIWYSLCLFREGALFLFAHGVIWWKGYRLDVGEGGPVQHSCNPLTYIT
jgi:hypothetical protein